MRIYEQQQETYVPVFAIFGTFNRKSPEITIKRWENINSFYCNS